MTLNKDEKNKIMPPGELIARRVNAIPSGIVGPIFAVLSIALLQILAESPLHDFTPFPVSLLSVVVIYSVFRSGILSGMISALMTVSYLAYYLDITGMLSSTPIDALNRLFSWVIALPIIVVIVGILKRRSLLAATLSERNRSLNKVAEAYSETLEAKKRVDTFIANADAILFSLNKTGIVTFSEGKGLVHVEVRAGERVGDSIFEIHQDKPEFLAHVRRALLGERLSCRVKLNNLWHEVHFEPLRDVQGHLFGATGVAFNINAQAISESALIDTQEKLKAVLKQVPVAFWAVGLNRKFIFREGIGISAADITSEEMIGKSIDDIYKNFPHVLQSMERGLAGERFEIETQIGDRHYNVAFAPSLNESGHITGVTGVTFDVTERKRMEDEKNDLEVRARSALEASRLKSDFLANMSHEIRTPINGVIGMLGLLSDTQLQLRQREYADAAMASADSLLTVINDILDFSKVESGKLEFEDIDFDLLHLFRDVEKAFSFEARNKGIILSFQMAPDVPKHVGGDPGRFRQILNNLLSNAIKFTPKGHISVRASCEPSEDGKNRVRVEVRDTGIGMPEHVLSRMFRAFSQADASTTRRFGGTGLGLSISKHLVEKMRGHIGVLSDDGVGSTFWFTVDLRSALAPKKLQFGTVGSFAGLSERKLRILVAEDNPINQKIALKVLEKMGLSADAVANGQEVLDAIRRIPYDLILMDCQMPELDGYEATRIIRASQTLPRTDIPIVAMTANAIVGDKEKCLKAGMNDYVSKPVKTDELFSVLKLWLAPLLTVVAEAHAIAEKSVGLKDQGAETLSFEEEKTPDIVSELMGIWLADMNVRLERIIAAMQEKNLAEIILEAHSIKETSRGMGAEKLAELASSIENAALDSQHLMLTELVQRLENSVGQATSQMSAIIKDGRFAA